MHTRSHSHTHVIVCSFKSARIHVIDRKPLLCQSFWSVEPKTGQGLEVKKGEENEMVENIGAVGGGGITRRGKQSEKEVT